MNNFRRTNFKNFFNSKNQIYSSMRLFTIPISLGLVYISYQKFRQLRKETKFKNPLTLAEPNLVSDVEVC